MVATLAAAIVDLATTLTTWIIAKPMFVHVHMEMVQLVPHALNITKINVKHVTLDIIWTLPICVIEMYAYAKTVTRQQEPVAKKMVHRYAVAAKMGLKLSYYS
jgi:hypothetical protein